MQLISREIAASWHDGTRWHFSMLHNLALRVLASCMLPWDSWQWGDRGKSLLIWTAQQLDQSKGLIFSYLHLVTSAHHFYTNIYLTALCHMCHVMKNKFQSDIDSPKSSKRQTEAQSDFFSLLINCSLNFLLGYEALAVVISDVNC